MKNFAITMFLLVFLPSTVFGGKAAPFTEEAYENIIEVMDENPQQASDMELRGEELIKRSVAYFSGVFEEAGYSFPDTIEQLVANMQNDPALLPEAQEGIFNNMYILLNILMFECNYDKELCVRFFPDTTQESIAWFIDNSPFNKSNNIHNTQSKISESK